jgi:N-acyl-D-aspartate/D-glutamate deacylase
MFTLVIRQARIGDGTGSPSVVGTSGIMDGRITYVPRCHDVAGHHGVRGA